MSRREELFQAIESGDLDRVDWLLEEDPACVNACADPARAPRGRRKWSPLHAAIHHGREDVAALLIERGADLDARNDEGRTPLHDSIEDGRMRTQRLLLRRGAEVDVCAAAILGRIDRLRELLDGDPGLANDRATGLSPLGWAAYGNQSEAARILIERGARRDDHELFCAAACGHAAVALTLMDHGADPDQARSEDGARPLHVAARMPFTCDAAELVEALLARGANPNVRTKSGETPLSLARAGAEREAVEHPAAAPQECKRFDLVIEKLVASGARE